MDVLRKQSYNFPFWISEDEKLATANNATSKTCFLCDINVKIYWGYFEKREDFQMSVQADIEKYNHCDRVS